MSLEQGAKSPTVPKESFGLRHGNAKLFPGRTAVGVDSIDGTVAYWRETRAALQRAKSILVVGGGATGLEFVGEVMDVISSPRTETSSLPRCRYVRIAVLNRPSVSHMVPSSMGETPDMPRCRSDSRHLPLQQEASNN